MPEAFRLCLRAVRRKSQLAAGPGYVLFLKLALKFLRNMCACIEGSENQVMIRTTKPLAAKDVALPGLVLLLCVAWAHATAATRSTESVVWFEHGKPTRAATAMLQAFRHADDWGLTRRDYAAPASLPADDPTANAVMSRTVRLFVSDLHFGRINPRRVGFDLPARAADLDLDAAVMALSTASDVNLMLASLEPPFEHYGYLKAQLSRYRELALEKSLTQLPAPVRYPIAQGDHYPGAGALRRLLSELGDLIAPPRPVASDVVDEHTIEAVRRFQFRHGLAQDGVVGRKTFAALTTPLTQRIDQISLTLERWRWLPISDAPTIIVNIPQFRLFAFASGNDSESKMVTMDVIVGQTYPHTRTPVFVGSLRYLIFQPYWDVPRNILLREMLPHIRSNPDYLVRNDLEIVSAAGSSTPTQHAAAAEISGLASGALRVRQRPGPRNSLGAVKFMLPNHYNVYLHGTPAVELFGQSRRTFSHGCIRVSDPLSLAEYALRQAPDPWPRARIAEVMHGTATQRVDLKQPIRVMIVYGTAVATQAGKIYFFDDVYGNDARLSSSLARR
jgi:murein L,D-transpeptidase YcbB/YkuD